MKRFENKEFLFVLVWFFLLLWGWPLICEVQDGEKVEYASLKCTALKNVEHLQRSGASK